VGKVGHPLSVGDPDAKARSLHSPEQYRRAGKNLHCGKPGLETARFVPDEPRLESVFYPLPGNPTKEGHELAAIAYAEAEGVFPVVKPLELFIGPL